MNRQDLIDELVESIRSLGVDFRAVEHLDAIAVINPTKNVGAYDTYRATPKVIAHEYFHKLEGHKRRRFENDVRCSQERDCNEQATEFLWEIFIREGGSIEYSQLFLEISGCDDYWLQRILPINPYSSLAMG